jgi:hypothetical protein
MAEIYFGSIISPKAHLWQILAKIINGCEGMKHPGMSMYYYSSPYPPL